MAAIVLADPSRFDGAAFYAFVGDSLPAYAAPIFVRLQEQPEMTGTFKLRKVDLQREGFDPDAIKEPLYVRDDGARAYVPLTPERYQAVMAGKLRI